MSTDPRSDAFRALTRFLVTEASLGDTLLRVTEITTGAIPAAQMAGISMMGADGRPTTNVFTDEATPEIDQAQFESGNGPCLDAWREKRTVRLDAMPAAREDYPEFAAAALDHGVLSTLSLPLVAAGEGIGALNLYAGSERAFSEEDETIGVELAAAAAVVLANASAYWSAFELGEGLREAMKTRGVIEQAKGMLMAQSEMLDAEGAFDLLRRASQRENVKLRDIAQRIVERRDQPESVHGSGAPNNVRA